MHKYQNKYRIESVRANWWNYAGDGTYFITICCKEHEHFLGDCVDGRMRLSTIGAIVQGFWYAIPDHFPFVELGAFVVMPNHLHGILVLNRGIVVEPLHCNGSTTIPKKNEFYSKISPKPGSISVVIRSFKSICSRRIHQSFPELDFAWQTRFWDHIVRDQQSFDRITNYIKNNPLNWNKDKFY